MTPRPVAAARERGFTLAETMVAMTIFLFILLAVMTTYSPNREIQVSGERRVDVQQNARLALADMARDIRTAGYFPENFAPTPADPPLATAVRLGTDEVLGIYGDTDGSGASTLLFYCLQGDRLLKIRGAVNSAGSYTCSGGQVIAERAADLQFRYYDASNNPIPDSSGSFQLDDQAAGGVPTLVDTTERAGVRKVVITLVMRDELPRRGEYLYALTSEIMLRNVS
jgi:prepilin-type N-terminal cleavage/methylation domain-containing protein